MTSLILAHLMNSIMDSIEVLLLSQSCDPHLVLARSLLSKHSLLNVSLCVPYALSEELSELSCMLSLLPCISLECLCDLRITLSVCLTAHSEVHSYLRALSSKVITKTLKDLRINSLSYSELMLVCPYEVLTCLDDLLELIRTYVAEWTLLRSHFTFMNITANQASEFLCHNCKI